MVPVVGVPVWSNAVHARKGTVKYSATQTAQTAVKAHPFLHLNTTDSIHSPAVPSHYENCSQPYTVFKQHSPLQQQR
jgi:hypothetical protein